jgi:hypothetical protein
MDDRGSIPGRGWGVFSLPQRPDTLWVPSSSNGGGGEWTISGGKAGGVNLTARHQLVPRLRMLGVTPPLLQHLLMTWYLIKQQMRLHGVVLS